MLTNCSSLILWRFCLRHPEVRDVCDIGQMLFWGKKWAWYATAVMFILNNTVGFVVSAPPQKEILLTGTIVQFIMVRSSRAVPTNATTNLTARLFMFLSEPSISTR